MKLTLLLRHRVNTRDDADADTNFPTNLSETHIVYAFSRTRIGSNLWHGCIFFSSISDAVAKKKKKIRVRSHFHDMRGEIKKAINYCA